jgi:GNAT superfamily N-acetyltransferase
MTDLPDLPSEAWRGSALRVREARPEDAAQMGRVFIDRYMAPNRGIVSAADLARRSYAQSEAAWRRGMREIEAARAARAAGAALPAEGRQRADTVFSVAEAVTADGTGGGEIVGLAVTGPAVLECLESTVPARWLRDAGEVFALSVAPGHRRRGAGRELVRTALEHHARSGRKRMIVGALAATAAPGFYEVVGGRLIGRCRYLSTAGLRRTYDGSFCLLPPPASWWGATWDWCL